MAHKLKGVIAAVPTPITRNGDPDVGRFVAHAKWCLTHGCDALNVLGTTGEANSLSADQRRSVMLAASRVVEGSRMMVGTGTPDLASTVALTREAYQLGFGGALLLPPYYYKGLPDESYFRWIEAVVQATDSTPIALYLYNFPQMTGVKFSPELVSRLREAFPNRLVGAKDSSGDLDYASELARISGLDVFPSNEGAIPRAASDGYAGVISATVNVSAELAGALWADPANALLAERVARVRREITAQPLIPAVKFLVSRIQGDIAFAAPLPPQLPLSFEQAAALERVDYSL